MVLRIDNHGYSRAVLRKIVEAGSQLKSYALASKMLDRLGEISISDRHVGRLTALIGQEMQDARDEQTQAWLKNRLQPRVEQGPEAVAVCVDGGRVMTRTPTKGHGPGVHEHGWREDKVACLHKLDGEAFEKDPHPTPPACFQDSQYVDQIVQDIKSHKKLADGENAKRFTARQFATAESANHKRR
jgi:hypothetical protein